MTTEIRKLTLSMICARYGVCSKTVKRWVEAGILPKPDMINNRRYFDELEVEECERQRMAKAAALHASRTISASI
jgi:predicted site-specific integrase-resolvase